MKRVGKAGRPCDSIVASLVVLVFFQSGQQSAAEDHDMKAGKSRRRGVSTVRNADFPEPDEKYGAFQKRLGKCQKIEFQTTRHLEGSKQGVPKW